MLFIFVQTTVTVTALCVNEHFLAVVCQFLVLMQQDLYHISFIHIHFISSLELLVGITYTTFMTSYLCFENTWWVWLCLLACIGWGTGWFREANWRILCAVSTTDFTSWLVSLNVEKSHGTTIQLCLVLDVDLVGAQGLSDAVALPHSWDNMHGTWETYNMGDTSIFCPIDYFQSTALVLNPPGPLSDHLYPVLKIAWNSTEMLLIHPELHLKSINRPSYFPPVSP